LMSYLNGSALLSTKSSGFAGTETWEELNFVARFQLQASPLNETVVYEVHVKGFSKLCPHIPEEIRGTYAIRQVKLPVRSPLPIALPPFSLSAPKGFWLLWPCRPQSDLKTYRTNDGQDKSSGMKF
jgi:hypothetical protein